MESSSIRCEIKRNKTFQTIISPDEGKIEIPRSFFDAWKYELLKKQDAKIRTTEKSSTVRLCLTDDECFMYYAHYVAEHFGFQKPTKVSLDYQIVNNVFEMTIIGTVEHLNRPRSFVTIINPFERNIQIPIEFYDQWERELHRLDYGRIVWNKQSVRVYFDFNGTEKVMYGNDVSYLFGFKRPTKVRLEYQIKNNIFSLSLIESSDDQDNASTVVLHGVQEDEPDQYAIQVKMDHDQQDKPSFFAIIKEGFNTNSMKVPKKIVMNLGEELWNNALIFLIGSSGEKWQMSILKKENDIYLQNIGWEKFLKDNSVLNEELLLFTYKEDNRFQVQIFCKNGLERPCVQKEPEVAAPIVPETTGSSQQKTPAGDSVCVKEEKEEAVAPMVVKRKRGRPRKNAPPPERCVKEKGAEAEAAATMAAKGMEDRPRTNDFPERVCVKKKEAEAAATTVAKGMKDSPRKNASPERVCVCVAKKEAEAARATMVAKGMMNRPKYVSPERVFVMKKAESATSTMAAKGMKDRPKYVSPERVFVMKKEAESATSTMAARGMKDIPKYVSPVRVFVPEKEAEATTETMAAKGTKDRPKYVSPERVFVVEKEAEAATSTMGVKGMKDKDRPKYVTPERVFVMKKEAEAAATMVARGIKDRPRNNASPQSVCLKKTEAVAAEQQWWLKE